MLGPLVRLGWGAFSAHMFGDDRLPRLTRSRSIPLGRLMPFADTPPPDGSRQGTHFSFWEAVMSHGTTKLQHAQASVVPDRTPAKAGTGRTHQRLGKPQLSPGQQASVDQIRGARRFADQVRAEAEARARVASLPIQHAHAAGIDAGDTTHWVCVESTADGSDTVREFPAHT